ncbi:MAG: hypothetical protein RL600_974, partial [Actinomycetota bacterium]
MVTGSVRVTGTDKAEGFEFAEAIFASKFGEANFQIALVWWVGITIIATFVLTRTRFGNWIFAAGGDANAARNAGVPVDRTKIMLFVYTALSAALVGTMFVLRLKGMQAGQGVGQEFYYIIAAAVGGTLLTGGAGSAIGASLGALIMGMAYIGIPYSRWDSDWTATFLGVILFTAVMINTYLELKNVGKQFGSVIALQGISIQVEPGSVTCVLGDNGAGKSTLIKILSGVHKQSSGEFRVEGKDAVFESPRDALTNGIATVFQDLATIPLMSVWRNFFLGNEIRSGFGPFKWLNVSKMKEIAKSELLAMGIDLRDVNQPIGTLSGGERQSVAIA